MVCAPYLEGSEMERTSSTHQGIRNKTKPYIGE
jgi:hypothetical protein